MISFLLLFLNCSLLLFAIIDIIFHFLSACLVLFLFDFENCSSNFETPLLEGIRIRQGEGASAESVFKQKTVLGAHIIRILCENRILNVIVKGWHDLLRIFIEVEVTT